MISILLKENSMLEDWPLGTTIVMVLNQESECNWRQNHVTTFGGPVESTSLPLNTKNSRLFRLYATVPTTRVVSFASVVI